MLHAVQRIVRLVALACVAVFAACANSEGPAGDATLVVRADLSGTSVATVVLRITAPDIPAPLVFNIPVSAGSASGVITIPAGSARTIAMQAFDSGGVETHSGSVVLNVQPTANTTVAIVLRPLTGDLPVVFTLGSLAVSVAPAVVNVAAGDTVRLTASLTDWDGNPTSGTVAWATTNPGIAVVDAAGLVMGTGPGTTAIVATFHGAAGAATITVGP